MAAPPVLLVADDLAVIASVKRVLAREGYECVLATNAADAVIAFGHLLPGLVILHPSVESDRGGVVLEELQIHPDTKLLRVVILGETVPGFAWPVEPLPLDVEHFKTVIEENIRGADEAGSWSVLETAPNAEPPVGADPTPPEPDAWRATAPPEVRPDVDVTETDVPIPQSIEAESRAAELEDKLFGDLAADVEASAMQSVESSLPRPTDDDEELQRLEDEVRAEAQRRRESRDAKAVTVKPSPPEPEPTPPSGEESFESFSDTPEAPPSRAGEVLSRAEQMVLEARSQSEAGRRAEEADQRTARDAAEAFARLQDELSRRVGEFETERELTRVRHENALEQQQQDHAAALERETARRADAERALDAEKEQRLAVEQRLDEVTAQLTAATTEAGSRAQLAAELEQLKSRNAELGIEVAQLDELATTELSKRDELEKTLADRDARLVETEAARAQLEAHVSDLETQLAAKDAALAAESAQVAERDARIAELEQTLAITADAHQTATAQRDARIAELEQSLANATGAHSTDSAERDARLAELEQALTEQTARRDARITELEQAIAERDARVAQLEHDLAADSDARATELATAQQQLTELSHALETARADATAAMALATELEGEREQRRVAETHLAETKRARDAAQAEMLTLEASRDELTAQLGDANSRIEGLLADVSSTSALAEETARERDTLRARLNELERVQQVAETLGAELEATRTRAEALEATATLASEKVKVLEAREIMPVALPGKRATGVARHGTVPLEGLARVVSQLVLSNAEVRLELGIEGGSRTLWFKRGQVIAAESSIDAESLIARARRDGLIDSRQETELRALKGATPREQLEALKNRGFIRDIESVPLVQRSTEQVALDAFTEPQTVYRLVEEPPAPEVLLATVPRPTLPMLAESLRRAVAPDVMLEQLGGGEAVPMATDSELDLRALGFSERERKMLTWIDGEATVEDLSLASGLKPDAAYRAMLVARLLGVIDVKPGTKKVEASGGQLDLRRLDAKYDEVQDADYFTILGLSRAAGSEDVRRAFDRLAQEFDPLRFSGHPDPSVQQRAQSVMTLLEEAAKALEDDRRRVEYARHLLD